MNVGRARRHETPVAVDDHMWNVLTILDSVSDGYVADTVARTFPVRG